MRAKVGVSTVMTAIGAAGLVGSALWMTTPPAAAAFPGSNGDIAFVSTRNNDVAIYQVNPQGSGLGTTTGDEDNTTPLTGGSVDAEPFYSPDGSTVYFSSNRSGFWSIYSIAQSAEEPPTTPTELSQMSGSESHDDYSPSVAPDGETVVFKRDNTALYTLYVSTGESSVCLLYTPPEGLAPASSDNGSGSRAVSDPQDQSKLLYVGGDNHIHLLSGIPTPPGTNPCGVSPSSLTDTDLSAEATAPAGESISGAADANPDLNPLGESATSVQVGGHNTNVIFDSTRGGGHTLWTMDLPPTHPASHRSGPVSSGRATSPIPSPSSRRTAPTSRIPSPSNTTEPRS